MKYIIILLSFLLILISYKYGQLQNQTSVEKITQPIEEIYESKVIFIGRNSGNGAFYYIQIACTGIFPGNVVDIPDDQAVEIVLLNDCENNRIPKDGIDLLTHKKFHYVYWYPQLPFRDIDNVKHYKFDDEEIRKIGQAPWEYLATEDLTHAQYKIIRNTKNAYRKGFEPTGSLQYYTVREQEKCGKYLAELSGIENPKGWELAAQKGEECYRNLPPLP